MQVDFAPEWVKVKRISKRGGRRESSARYGFELMRVGELRIIPVDEQTCTWRSFQVQVSRIAQALGFRLYCRRLDCGTFECYRDE